MDWLECVRVAVKMTDNGLVRNIAYRNVICMYVRVYELASLSFPVVSRYHANCSFFITDLLD